MVKISFIQVTQNKVKIIVKGHTLNFLCMTISKIVWLISVLSDELLYHHKESGLSEIIISLNENKIISLLEFLLTLEEENKNYIQVEVNLIER